MSFFDDVKRCAKEQKKRIVLPESMDERVLKAAFYCQSEGIADIYLIGNEEKIDFSITSLEGINIVDPCNYEELDKLVNDFYDLRKAKGMTLEEARNILTTNYMYFACMLVYEGLADGIVSGACHSTADTLRPALQIIKTAPDCELVSSFFLMDVPSCSYGQNGLFVFSDCGLVQNPTSLELASLAFSSAKSFELLVGSEPIVAFLSHSTMGSAKHDDVSKVVSAVAIAKEKYPMYKMDGELQLDAAIVPSVAELKAPDSLVAGKANVLIFPDLDAGNIGYKLVQRLGNASAYGPITQGIRKPVNDLSRGCSVEDIVGVVAITAVQAQEKITD